MNLAPLQSNFGQRVLLDEPLARYTAARIGGPADAVLVVLSVDELVQAASLMWESRQPFMILGGGSNTLISDAGVRGLVLINRARKIVFQSKLTPPEVLAESGASTGMVARQAATKGLGGFEWAAGIPGTIGGAIVGNAGAHGGDIASNLSVAEILQQSGKREIWPVEHLEFKYRSSILKRQPSLGIVLSATIRLQNTPIEEINALMERYLEQRRHTQPPGASMGSMFKNPPGDFAGRLIDMAGLKGTRIGGAQISAKHANFFINEGGRDRPGCPRADRACPANG